MMKTFYFYFITYQSLYLYFLLMHFFLYGVKVEILIKHIYFHNDLFWDLIMSSFPPGIDKLETRFSHSLIPV